jgi:hypothetical protein
MDRWGNATSAASCCTSIYFDVEVIPLHLLTKYSLCTLLCYNSFSKHYNISDMYNTVFMKTLQLLLYGGICILRTSASPLSPPTLQQRCAHKGSQYCHGDGEPSTGLDYDTDGIHRNGIYLGMYPSACKPIYHGTTILTRELTVCRSKRDFD